MTTPSIKDFFTAEFKAGASYLIYGEDKSGKTTLMLSASSKVVEKGGKVLWVDCGARLHPTRLRQVIPPDKLNQIYVTQPRSFREQLESISKVHDFLPSDTTLVVCDDFTNLHRLELTGKPSQDLPIYRALSFQAALFKNLALTRKISVVLVGLVHEIPVINVAEPVAARIVTYWSDCVAKVIKKENVSVLQQEKPVAMKAFFKVVERGVEFLKL